MSDRKPIFISYRRSDEPFAATLIYQKLEEAFGDEQVFKDVDSFAPGDDFPKKLSEFVEQSDVFLAIIGPRWMTAEDTLGRRIDNPNDWVRIEIASALAQQKRVVPLLVNDAEMPLPEDLPDNIKSLSRKHAFRINPERANSDSIGLISALKSLLEEAERERSDARQKAEPEAARLAEEKAAQKREEKLREEAEATPVGGLSSGEVAAMRAIQNWDYIKARDVINEHRDHLAKYPNDETARFAAAALERLVWTSTDQSSLEALMTFLDEFPDGSHSADAKKLLQTRAESNARERENQTRSLPEMVRIAGGTFLMGSPEDELGRARDEGPQRDVTIQAFEMARTETTFDQWQACVTGVAAQRCLILMIGVGEGVHAP